MRHEVLSHKDSFDIVFDMLKSGDPFSFVRFGDGDHIIMYEDSLGQIVGGGNRFFVTPELRSEIIECYNIQDKDFLIGTTLNDYGPHQMIRFETPINLSKLPTLVQRSEMLAMSCLFETFLNDINGFIEFSQELKKTSTMFVCSYNHENISKVYGQVEHFIQVYPINCYSNIDFWYGKILENLDKVDKIVLSAGFAGRVVAKRLFKDGVKKIVLDVGSLSDAFIFQTGIKDRINTRTFMRRVEIRINENVNILL